MVGTSPTSYPTLSSPPIREALIDIRLSQRVEFARLQTLRSQFEQEFPKCSQIKQGSWNFAFESTGNHLASGEQIDFGFRLESTDGAVVLQTRIDGFTLSYIRHYSNWRELADHAKILWIKFAGGLEIGTVSRIAVRYINTIDIPTSPALDFDDYLTCAPRIPAKLPQQLVGFFSRVVVPIPSLPATAIVTHALDSASATAVSVILDIDVFDEGNFPAQTDAVWPKLDSLRAAKNDIFFSALTERCVELFR